MGIICFLCDAISSKKIYIIFTFPWRCIAPSTPAWYKISDFREVASATLKTISPKLGRTNSNIIMVYLLLSSLEHLLLLRGEVRMQLVSFK